MRREHVSLQVVDLVGITGVARRTGRCPQLAHPCGRLKAAIHPRREPPGARAEALSPQPLLVREIPTAPAGTELRRTGRPLAGGALIHAGPAARRRLIRHAVQGGLRVHGLRLLERGGLVVRMRDVLFGWPTARVRGFRSRPSHSFRERSDSLLCACVKRSVGLFKERDSVARRALCSSSSGP